VHCVSRVGEDDEQSRRREVDDYEVKSYVFKAVVVSSSSKKREGCGRDKKLVAECLLEGRLRRGGCVFVLGDVSAQAVP
jgi:hypothetical protein